MLRTKPRNLDSGLAEVSGQSKYRKLIVGDLTGLAEVGASGRERAQASTSERAQASASERPFLGKNSKKT